MKDLRWPHAILALGVVAVLGWLAYEGKDGATVITGMLALLAALGFVAYQQSEIKSQNEAIKHQTNGNVSQLVAELAQARRDIMQLQEEKAALALRVPPPDLDVTPVVE